MRTQLLATLFLICAYVPSLAQEIPDSSSIQSQVKAAIKGFWQISDFRVIAAVKQGDPITPKALIRFEADVSPSHDLFSTTGEQIGPFAVVIPTFGSADKRTLFGTLQLQYKAGNWSGIPIIENPVSNLGQPRDMFASPTIILGSKEQASVLKKMHDGTIRKAESRLNGALAEVTIEHDSALAAAQRQLQAKLKGLKENYSPRIATEEARLASALARLQKEHAKQIEALETELKGKLAGEISNLEAKLAAKRKRSLKAIGDAEVELAKQTTLNEKLTTIANKERDIEALRSQHRARQLKLFESFGKKIPISIRCKAIGRDYTASFNIPFIIKEVRSTGLYGHAGGSQKTSVNLVLISGSSSPTKRFRLTIGYNNILGSYDVVLNAAGSMTGSATGDSDFNNGTYYRKYNGRCDVALATG